MKVSQATRLSSVCIKKFEESLKSALVSVTLQQGRSETGFPGSLSFQQAFISLLSLQQWRADYLFKKQIPSFYNLSWPNSLLSYLNCLMKSKWQKISSWSL